MAVGVIVGTCDGVVDGLLGSTVGNTDGPVGSTEGDPQVVNFAQVIFVNDMFKVNIIRSCKRFDGSNDGESDGK